MPIAGNITRASSTLITQAKVSATIFTTAKAVIFVGDLDCHRQLVDESEAPRQRATSSERLAPGKQVLAVRVDDGWCWHASSASQSSSRGNNGLPT
jgi:hypothetical protein